MKAATLGTWKNPPLAYVVAELVISPHYSMSNALPGLQQELRDTFPRTIEAQELVGFANNKPSIQPLWQLLSSDQRQGLQLSTRAIALHATGYLDSKDFLGRWAEILDAIGTANLGAFVERAGLRYVDLIVPSDDYHPSDYLVEHLQGVALEGAVSTGSMWAAGFQFDGSVVNLRAAAPSPKGLVLPPDFNALELHKPEIMLEAEKRLKADKSIGFIDTDCMKDIQCLFDATKLAEIYSEMQKLTSTTFMTVLSTLAQEEWI